MGSTPPRGLEPARRRWFAARTDRRIRGPLVVANPSPGRLRGRGRLHPRPRPARPQPVHPRPAHHRPGRRGRRPAQHPPRRRARPPGPDHRRVRRRRPPGCPPRPGGRPQPATVQPRRLLSQQRGQPGRPLHAGPQGRRRPAWLPARCRCGDPGGGQGDPCRGRGGRLAGRPLAPSRRHLRPPPPSPRHHHALGPGHPPSLSSTWRLL